MLKISKAQVAHVLGAVVLVPLANVVATWASAHLPGVDISPTEAANVGYIAAAGGAALALHYVRGLRELQLAEARGLIEVEGGSDELDSLFTGTKVTPGDAEQRDGDAGKAVVTADDDVAKGGA